LATTICALGLVSCASTSPEPAFRDVARHVQARSGQRIRWAEAESDPGAIGRAVRTLLNEELSVDAAVQVALLKNPTMRATYEDLAIAQADLVQAGLLKNPVFGASITAAERDNLTPNFVGSVTQDFLDLLMIPARRSVAASALVAVKARVGDAVLDLAADVSKAYFAVQAAAQIVAMRTLVAQAARASAELAARQHDAGNISDLALANEEGVFEGLKVDLARSELDLASARERLTRLMGLWGTATEWRMRPRLPEVPAAEVPLEHVETWAVTRRLDLEAKRHEAESLTHALSLAKWTRWTGVIEIGADVARLKSGEVVVGPNARIELPIFDQRQAVVERLESMSRTAELALQAKAVEVRSEVREARLRVVYARRLVERYKSVVVPLRERIVALSQLEYDAMLLGVYQLLLARQAEVTAYREYIEGVRDYWVARADLERAAGGRLAPVGAPSDPGERSVDTPASAPASSEHEHHHHHQP
jgi:cobalt-zinc-cadmium efflux system outer membrane protein